MEGYKYQINPLHAECCFHIIVKFYASDYDSASNSVTSENQPKV